MVGPTRYLHLSTVVASVEMFLLHFVSEVSQSSQVTADLFLIPIHKVLAGKLKPFCNFHAIDKVVIFLWSPLTFGEFSETATCLSLSGAVGPGKFYEVNTIFAHHIIHPVLWDLLAFLSAYLRNGMQIASILL